MKLAPFFGNDARATRAIPELSKLSDCGPGSAVVDLAAGLEKKLIDELVDRPGFDLSKPEEHCLFKLGQIRAARFLTKDAPAVACESLENLTE